MSALQQLHVEYNELFVKESDMGMEVFMLITYFVYQRHTMFLFHIDFSTSKKCPKLLKIKVTVTII